MRIVRISFVFVLSLICSHSIFSMDKPRQERGLLAGIAHWVNQELYPLNFYTDDFAPVVATTVLKFDPNHPKHESYTGDKENLADVVSALSRHRKGLISLWNACKEQNAEVMETLKQAQEKRPGYCSLNHIAILSGFWETRVRATNNYLQKLNLHVAPGILPVAQINELEQSQNSSTLEFPDEKHFPSVEKVKKEVLESHPDLASKFWHWIVKNYIEDIPHLLNKKSQIVSMATLHLHTMHPHHTAGNDIWKLNLNDTFHLSLLYQVIDREYKLSSIIEAALINNDLATITKLDPNNPHNQEVMSLVASSYPPIIRALITGYIHKVKCDKEADEQKRKDQEEQIRKSQEINRLFNSLNKTLSTNKEKLASLTEEQKNLPTTIASKLHSHGAGLLEIRRAYLALTDFEKLINQLLQSQQPPAQPLASTSSAQLPQPAPAAAQVPVQTIVDTAHLAASTTPPPTSVIQQTQLASPAPLPPAPVEPPAAASPKSSTPSPSSSIAPASDTPATVSPTNVSPQVSPPRTPEGSLVVAQAEDEFNPRATQANAQAPMPTQTPPAAKQSAEPKGKKKGR